MHIAILSDIHDNVWNLEVALEFLVDEADALICCGDLCSPFIIRQLAEGFEGPVHIVFGNNDADLYRMSFIAMGYDHVHLHGEAFIGELGGDNFAINHYPDIAQGLALAGIYDVVCYGHNHDFKVESVGHCLKINPGAIMGYHPGSGKDIPATFLIYNTEKGDVEAYEILEGEVITYDDRA